MALNLANWLKGVKYRLGGSAISVMEVPPNWSYTQYLQAYGQIGWLFAANSLISESVAEVSWHLYEKDGNVLGDEVESHPLLDMWAYVNPFQTKYQFMQLLQMYLGLVGEGFIVLNFNGLGVPVEMWLAPPQFMYIIPSRETYISHYEYRYGGSVLRLEVPEVIHVNSPNPFNPYRGLGAAQSVGVDMDSERYAARYQQRLFYNDATPGLIVEYPEMPEAPERKKIREEWDEIHRGWRNARKTGFLWGGAKANTLALTNRDMEYWRLRKLNRETIIGAYRIPTSMLGLEGPGSRARVEADELIFAKYCVKPALTRVKEALNEQLLPLYDDGFEFKFEDPVPENREAIIDECTKLYPANIITREEARIKLGYDEKPAKGETLVAPMNMLPEVVNGMPKSLGAKTFTDEQKDARWRVYAAKAEQDETMLKRVFKRLWDSQATRVATTYGETGQLDQAFDELAEAEIWNRSLEPAIKAIFADAYDLALTGGTIEPAHRGKQEAMLDQIALEWITTRSLKLAKMVNGYTKEQLRPILAEGLAAGESPLEIERRIQDYYKGGYEWRANLVARTEVIAATNEGAIQGYEKAGIQKAEFYAALDERTCTQCGGLHETQYPITETHEIIPVHPQCRCTWVPVV